ncbi:unnamed protein product [Meloidogyne enterolobii]|uniref:Uncharacterized protein n=1 Tax=Meloidogyne enterolobii TaxID=390850 RepID=A0ACB0ZRF1_MELEN
MKSKTAIQALKAYEDLETREASETEKISIMQPIILDSEIESGMTISMKSEVSESTTEANMTN